MQTATPSELHALLVFREVVRHGGFAAAAHAIGIPKPTISRKIRELEDRLAVRLLNRTTRSISLTEAGELLVDECEALSASIDRAFDLADAARGSPSGVVRVTTTFALAHRLVAPRISALLRRYSDLSVQLDLRNERVDLVREGFDLGFRVGGLNDDSYSSRTIARSRTYLVAASSYLAERGAPNSVNALANHAVGMLAIGRVDDIMKMQLTDSEGAQQTVSLRPRLMVNDPEPLLDAVRAGACIALLPDLIASPEIENGVCVRVLEDWRGADQDYCAVYPSRRGLPLRVRLFLDHLIEMGDRMD